MAERFAATGMPEAAANLAAHTLSTNDQADAEAVVSGFVEAGHPPTERLLAALVDRGNDELAITLADTGLGHAGREPAALLAERGRHGELLDRTHKGNEHCAQRLVARAHEGKIPNSERLLAEGL
ncbi:hypothetical protein ACQPYE_28155 [Actinosynnema sp. CA-299493]